MPDLFFVCYTSLSYFSDKRQPEVSRINPRGLPSLDLLGSYSYKRAQEAGREIVSRSDCRPCLFVARPGECVPGRHGAYYKPEMIKDVSPTGVIPREEVEGPITSSYNVLGKPTDVGVAVFALCKKPGDRPWDIVQRS